MFFIVVLPASLALVDALSAIIPKTFGSFISELPFLIS